MKITRRQLKQIISETLFKEEDAEVKEEEEETPKKFGEAEPTVIETQYGSITAAILKKGLQRVLDTHKPKTLYKVAIKKLIDNEAWGDENEEEAHMRVVLAAMAKKDFVPGWTQAYYDKALGLNQARA
jgi:hypothetical protein